MDLTKIFTDFLDKKVSLEDTVAAMFKAQTGRDCDAEMLREIMEESKNE